MRREEGGDLGGAAEVDLPGIQSLASLAGKLSRRGARWVFDFSAPTASSSAVTFRAWRSLTPRRVGSAPRSTSPDISASRITMSDVTSSTVEYGPIAAEEGVPVKLVAYTNPSYGTDKIILAPGVNGASDHVGKEVAVLELLAAGLRNTG